MDKQWPLSCAPQYSMRQIKNWWVDIVLSAFEENCNKRNSLARTFRIELTRNTTIIQTPETNKAIIRDILAKNGERIITIIAEQTCVRDTATPHNLAGKIYQEVCQKFWVSTAEEA